MTTDRSEAVTIPTKRQELVGFDPQDGCLWISPGPGLFGSSTYLNDEQRAALIEALGGTPREDPAA